MTSQQGYSPYAYLQQGTQQHAPSPRPSSASSSSTSDPQGSHLVRDIHLFFLFLRAFHWLSRALRCRMHFFFSWHYQMQEQRGASVIDWTSANRHCMHTGLDHWQVHVLQEVSIPSQRRPIQENLLACVVLFRAVLLQQNEPLTHSPFHLEVNSAIRRRSRSSNASLATPSTT